MDIELIKTRLGQEKTNLNLMVKANKIIHSKPKKLCVDWKIEELESLGLTLPTIKKLFIPSDCGNIGFSKYAVRNSRIRIESNLKRIEKFEQLEANKGKASKIYPFKGGKIVLNYSHNIIEICHDLKPNYGTIRTLRSLCYKWSRVSKLWFKSYDSAALEYILNLFNINQNVI